MYMYLLATDGSDNSLRAAEHLLDIAGNHAGVEITVISVYNLQPFSIMDMTTMDFDRLSEAARNLAQSAMDKTMAVFKAAGIEVKGMIKEGDPGLTIVETANSLKSNQIVMGTRGLGSVMELFMGSVSHKVVSLSKCPVTLVK